MSTQLETWNKDIFFYKGLAINKTKHCYLHISHNSKRNGVTVKKFKWISHRFKKQYKGDSYTSLTSVLLFFNFSPTSHALHIPSHQASGIRITYYYYYNVDIMYHRSYKLHLSFEFLYTILSKKKTFLVFCLSGVGQKAETRNELKNSHVHDIIWIYGLALLFFLHAYNMMYCVSC